MLAVTDLEIRVGARQLMEGVTFRVDKGDKVGLVGRNGAGKTTLTKTLAGETLPTGVASCKACGVSQTGIFAQPIAPPSQPQYSYPPQAPQPIAAAPLPGYPPQGYAPQGYAPQGYPAPQAYGAPPPYIVQETVRDAA